MYETLLTNEECANAIDMGNFYRVPSDKRDLNYDNYLSKGTKRNGITEFNSSNTKLLSVEETMKKLHEIQELNYEIEKYMNSKEK